MNRLREFIGFIRWLSSDSAGAECPRGACDSLRPKGIRSRHRMPVHLDRVQFQLRLCVGGGDVSLLHLWFGRGLQLLHSGLLGLLHSLFGSRPGDRARRADPKD